jgi:ABC-2 type transport system ATP-binding protein
VAEAIEISAVSKQFRLYKEHSKSFKERIIRVGRNPYEEFWALRDVDFSVAEGETVGILGHNGSGKSTLLKCVAGTLRPTSGRIATRGRVAALLELGAGFHPELTGRENVYLNGSILGFKEKEVDRIFDDIVDFAELHEFIDLQVKHYSSGMYARLGFAVAVNVEPDVLLVDEVLSVGDEAFQRKSMERMKGFQRDGRTLLIVTHAADLVRQLCTRGAVLDHGDLVTIGDPADAVRVFRETLMRRGIEIPAEAAEAPAERLTKTVRFRSVRLDFDGAAPFVRSGESFRVRIAYEASQRVEDCVFAVAIHDQEGILVMTTNSELAGFATPVEAGLGEVVLELGPIPLLDGKYLLSVGVHDDSGIEFDHRDQLDDFDVMSGTRTHGLVNIPLRVTYQGTVLKGSSEPSSRTLPTS